MYNINNNFKDTKETELFQDLSKTLSHAILKSSDTKWVPDLKNYDVEIYVNMTDDDVIVGVPLPRYDCRGDYGNFYDAEKNNFTYRNYMKHGNIGMRTSLAWAIAK